MKWFKMHIQTIFAVKCASQTLQENGFLPWWTEAICIFRYAFYSQIWFVSSLIYWFFTFRLIKNQSSFLTPAPSFVGQQQWKYFKAAFIFIQSPTSSFYQKPPPYYVALFWACNIVWQCSSKYFGLTDY